MNSLVALVLLGQIIGCTFSHHLPSHGDCNSEDAEKWAHLAVDYLNEHNLHGYKYALNIIKDIHVLPRRPHGKVVFLELQFLETVCHVLDPTDIKNCTVRPQHYHAVEGDCDVKIIHDENRDHVVAAKCHSSPDSVEDVRQHCPKCPILLQLNDPHVLDAVEYVLNKHNEKLSGHVYEVLEISRGQSKFEPEGYYVEFAIVQTNCTAQEAQDAHHLCHPNTTIKPHIGFCRATVFRSHASLEKLKDEKFESDCVIFDDKEGHAYSHLIEHYVGKYSTSPGYNTTVLNLVHSHNHTSASHESHSHEHMVEVPVAVANGVVPTVIPSHHTHPVNLCPGKVHHFKV